MTSNLAQRLAVAAVGIPVVLGVAWIGGALMAAGLGVLAVLGVREIGTMAAARRWPFFTRLAPAAAAVVPAVAWVFGAPGTIACLTLLLAVFLAVATLRIPPEEGPWLATALSLTAVLYVGGLISFALLLREDLAGGGSIGFRLFLVPLAVTWLADTAAYFGGRAFGRRPLAPIVSPNKTIAGAVAALVAGPVAFIAIVHGAIPELAGTHVGFLAAAGSIVAAAAILGDLAESALKRETGVKDSSNLLPGHGGLLDRMDSLLWAFPASWAVLGLLL